MRGSHHGLAATAVHSREAGYIYATGIVIGDVANPCTDGADHTFFPTSGIVDHGVGQKPLQPRVLVLQRLQSPSLGHIHPAEAGLPVVDPGVADPVLAAQIGDRYPGLVFLQNSDDLLLLRSGCVSCPGPLDGPERTSNRRSKGQGQRLSSTFASGVALFATILAFPTGPHVVGKDLFMHGTAYEGYG